MEDVDLRKIPEVAYLNTDNAWRYRAIVHYCYRKHEHMQTYVYPEDIFRELSGDAHFQEYTFEQLTQDLGQLVQWNNLKPQQETGKARSIKDFQRKRFRYQCTPYTVEIERMVTRLKSLGDEFGGSLETTQFDRIQYCLGRLMHDVDKVSDEELRQTWLDLQHYFKSLIENASDYLAHLKSARVEERMQTRAFVIYKDKFTQYLQGFVLGLQRSSIRIGKLFQEKTVEDLQVIFGRIADRELAIRVMDEDLTRESIQADLQESFVVMRDWFMGTDYRESELHSLYKETGETIRRITRFAQRLAEQHQSFRSRKTDYLYLAGWFAELSDKDEADRLSAALFGAPGVRHFYVQERSSDRIDSSIFEESPTVLEIKPRTNNYRERTRQSAISDQRAEKEKLRQAHLEQQRQLNQLLDELVVNHEIDLGKLPVVTREVRKTLLGWISRCLQHRGSIHTETGREVKLVWNPKTKKQVCLHSEDGDFWLPAMKLQVTEEDERSGT